jgi:lysozyme
MRTSLLAIAAAGALLALLAKREPSPGRGDYLSPEDAPDFVGPPSWAMPDFPPVDSDGPLDPRDILARPLPAAERLPSARLSDWLRQKERFVGQRYELGDGGYTIGYGWFEPYSRAHLMPLTITEAEARAVFDEHIETRGARWVRQYVAVPVTQSEFDALTSMAFNLSPQSFRLIAEALNAGQDWQAVALRFTRPGTNLERGLQRRRAAEFAMFENGAYT